MIHPKSRHVHIEPKPVATIASTEQIMIPQPKKDRQEKAKLEALYNEFTERIKKILLDASPPLPQSQRQKPEPDEKMGDLKVCPTICTGTGEHQDDVCDSCGAMNKEGKLGHYPWDELEMKKHGWMDQHGKHWGNIEPRDDLELLHCGVVDREGVPTNEEDLGSTARLILRRKMSQEEMRQFMSGHVRFGPAVVVEIPAAELQMSEKEKGEAVDQQTLITLRSMEEPLVTFDCYNVDGGEVTRVETDRKNATLLKCPDRLVYIERGGQEEMLVAAHIDKTTGRLATKCLQNTN